MDRTGSHVCTPLLARSRGHIDEIASHRTNPLANKFASSHSKGNHHDDGSHTYDDAEHGQHGSEDVHPERTQCHTKYTHEVTEHVDSWKKFISMGLQILSISEFV